MARVRKENGERSSWHDITGIILCALGLMLLLGVVSYNPAEIPLFRNQTESCNLIGPLGAYCAFVVFMYFGVTGYLIPLSVIWMGVETVRCPGRRIYPRLLWLLLAIFCLASLMELYPIWFKLVEKLNIGSAGGLMGEMIMRRSLGRVIGTAGASILCIAGLSVALVRLLNINVVDLFHWIKEKIKHLRVETTPEEIFAVEEKTEKKRRKRKMTTPKVQQPAVDIQKIIKERQTNIEKTPAVVPPPPKPKPPKSSGPKKKAKPAVFADVDKAGTHSGYQLPPISLLDPPHRQSGSMSTSAIAETAQILQDALEEFGVQATVTGVQQGPVVTCYEILPAPGVRVERIKGLADNLALKMHAESIRIQAPIPGKGVCGVEIPNPSRQSVYLREVVESPAFQSGGHELPLVLGKDVSGELLVSDLTKMPHVLIAGATGSGKSVCMNSILTGMLMRRTPDELRLILIDPKTVEFRDYRDLPHLVVPVITNAKKVALGLRWAIDEMERRFKWFNQVGVRDLRGFNTRVIEKQTDLFSDNSAGQEDKQDTIPEKLPYIVIVIDELADLMHVAQAEIESAIARLAAKSRAAGIHMILATQRPDVKVITGTIKANFPVRIAFKVTAKVDSRTILDRMGADTLLGKGDMLFIPPGSDRLIRAQGVFTSDREIRAVTDFCRKQCKPEFVAEIHEKIQKKTTELPELDSGEDDEIIEQAIEVIRQTKRASTSSLQRRLRIGYTRAARIMDLLEERGIIGPPNGSEPREILIDLDGEIPKNTGPDDGTN